MKSVRSGFSIGTCRALLVGLITSTVFSASAHASSQRTPRTVIWVTQTGSGDLSGADTANASAWSTVRTQLQSNTTYRFLGDIYGGMPQEANNLTGITFDGAAGGPDVARFRNDLPIEPDQLLEGPGGVFSFDASAPPPSMVWDYQQDDQDGTATGVTFSDQHIAQAFAGRSVRVQDRFAPWFGHLHPADTTPEELLPGQWAYSGGRVFIRPPVAGDISEVASKLRKIGSARGVYFKASSDIEIRHLDFVGFGNPGGQTAAVYTSGCRGIYLKDIIAYDSGYRAFNLEGNTGDTLPLDIVLVDCIAAGDTIITGALSNNPIVVYNRSGCTDCNASFRGGGIAAYPWLDYNGRPLLGDPNGIETPVPIDYKPAGFYTHNGLTGIGMGGFDFEDFFVVSFCQPLNEKHGLSMVWTAEGIGRINRAELALPVTGTDPDTYPIRFKDSVFYCSPGLVQHILFDRCRFVTPKPRGGLESYSGTISSWFPAPESNTALYIRSSELILHQLDASPDNGLFRLISSSNTLCLDLCTVVEVTTTSQFRVDSTFRTADGATVRLRACLFATTRADGMNQHFLYRPTGASVQSDYDPIAWSGIDVQSCWFFNYSPSRFNERFGTSTIAGLTYSEFLLANTSGGASQDYVSGEFVFALDPLFEHPDSGLITPLPESPVFTQKHTPLPDLLGLKDFNSKPYTGAFGAVQQLPLLCPGDANGDGQVNLADLNIVLANFGQQTDQGDLNGDGLVNLADLNIVLATFGSSCDD